MTAVPQPDKGEAAVAAADLLPNHWPKPTNE